MNIEEMFDVFLEEETGNEKDEGSDEEYVKSNDNDVDDVDSADDGDDLEESNSFGNDKEGVQEKADGEEKTFQKGNNSSTPEEEEQDNSKESNEEENREVNPEEGTDDSELGRENTEDDALKDDEVCGDGMACTEKAGNAKRTLVFAFLTIFIALALIFGYFVFFNKNVVGTWKIDKNGENKGVAALIFDSDGKATYTTGSYAVKGNWSKDGDNLNLEIITDDGSIFSGKYACRVSTGLVDKTVELTSAKNERINLKQYKMEEAVHPVSNFVPKGELLGKWSTGKEGGYTYEFKDNGLAVLTRENVTITFTYYFDDESITFMRYYLKDSADESPRTRVGYAVKDGTLKIGSMNLKKV